MAEGLRIVILLKMATALAAQYVQLPRAVIPWAALAIRSFAAALLFAALARAAEGCIGEFNAQDFANTAWAFATVVESNVPLFVLLARAVERRVGDFKPQNLTNTV